MSIRFREMTTVRHTDRRPPSAAVALLIALGIGAVQALLIPLFAGPAANLGPRDLPVVVAGPAQATAALVEGLRRAEPGAFEITTAADAGAADTLLRDREAYAAFVIQPTGLELHTASGASPTVATLLGQAATQLGAAQGQAVRVVDVVPGAPEDPRGSGFAAGFLPLALTAMLAGIAIALRVSGRWSKAFGVLTFGVLAGLLGTLVLQTWLGVLAGGFLFNAAVLGLFCVAVAGTLAGLGSVLGAAGLGLGAAVVFLVGNPLSAVAAAPELLPQPWGAVGQALPIGAGGTLLRSLAFFDGAGAAVPAWVLAAYAVGGLLLVLVGRSRSILGAPAAPSAVSSSGTERDAADPGRGAVMNRG
jgi:hypothetical protein